MRNLTTACLMAILLSGCVAPPPAPRRESGPPPAVLRLMAAHPEHAGDVRAGRVWLGMTEDQARMVWHMWSSDAFPYRFVTARAEYLTLRPVRGHPHQGAALYFENGILVAISD